MYRQDLRSAAPPRTLTTEFTCKAVVPAAPGARTLDVWLPVPSDSAYQSVGKLSVDAPVPHRLTRERKHGNRMIALRAGGSQTPLAVTVRFTVHRREVRVLDGGDNYAALARGRDALQGALEPDRNVPLGGRYLGIARQVVGENATPLERERALFEHVVATMQYDYKKESPKLGEGDVAFVCDYKKGNCSDLHSYLISLSRSMKIPAYLEFGFPVTGIPLADPLAREGTIGGYHCWTWFRDPARGWVPLDASDARRWLDSGRPDIKDRLFGNLMLERSAVAFSRGRDLVLEPKQRGGPLNYFIAPYAEADGKPVPATWEIRYRLV